MCASCSTATLSESLDEYYQQIGRAGRDGEPAEACLFFHFTDLRLRRFLGSTGKVDAEDLHEVATAVGHAEGNLTVDGLLDDFHLSRRALTLVLSRLEDADAIELGGDGVVHARGAVEDADGAARQALDIEERRKQLEASRFEMMRGYAETKGCRRRFLLTYFGENYDHDCGFCDNCESGTARGIASRDDECPFPASSRVRHTDWGEGQVLRVEGDRLVVLFDDIGYKTLSVELTQRNNLLELVAGC